MKSVFTILLLICCLDAAIPNGVFIRVITLIKRNKLDSAYDYISKYLNDDQRDPDVYVLLVNYYFKKARIEYPTGRKGNTANDKVMIHTDPQTGRDVGFIKGRTEYNLDTLQRGIESYRTGIGINSDDLQNRLFEALIAGSTDAVRVFSDLGSYYIEKDDCEKALQYLTVANKIAPEDCGVLANILEVYARQGQMQKAVSYYNGIRSTGCQEQAESTIDKLKALGIFKTGEIVLTNGKRASTLFLDTAGCHVTILRDKNPTQIKKALLEHILINGDTLSYAGFICTEVVSKAQRYQDTPEFKLWDIIKSLSTNYESMTAGSNVGLALNPLHGDADIRYKNDVEEDVKKILTNAGYKARPVRIEWIIANMGQRTANPRYVFLTPRLVGRGASYAGISIASPGHIGSVAGYAGIASGFLSVSTASPKAKIEVNAELSVVDLWTANVVFQTSSMSSGAAFMREVYSFNGAPIQLGSVTKSIERRTSMVLREIIDAVETYVKAKR